MLRIGVTGYIDDQFDKKQAIDILQSVFGKFYSMFKDNIVIVLPLPNMGIPKLAFKLAKNYDWKTIGIASKKLAEKFPQLNVDEKIIVGEDFGDESSTFLKNINVLIRIGGRTQARQEAVTAKNLKIPVAEYEVNLKT